VKEEIVSEQGALIIGLKVYKDQSVLINLVEIEKCKGGERCEEIFDSSIDVWSDYDRNLLPVSRGKT